MRTVDGSIGEHTAEANVLSVVTGYGGKRVDSRGVGIYQGCMLDNLFVVSLSSMAFMI
jgi:hypothetical protein